MMSNAMIYISISIVITYLEILCSITKLERYKFLFFKINVGHIIEQIFLHQSNMPTHFCYLKNQIKSVPFGDIARAVIPFSFLSQITNHKYLKIIHEIKKNN